MVAMQKKYEVSKNPGITKSIVDKMVEDKIKSGEKRQVVTAPSDDTLKKLSDEIIQNSTDYSSISEILPDTTLAMQVLVSSILSPKDMMSSELHYSLQDPGIEEEVSSGIIRIIEDHFENTFKLKESLSDMLHDMLFRKGAYPIVVLPESTIDDVINSKDSVSFESIQPLMDGDRMKPLGLLGGIDENNEVSFESYFSPDAAGRSVEQKINDYTVVVDNPDAIKMPQLLDRLRSQKVDHLVGGLRLSMEAKKTVEVYKERIYNKRNIVDLKSPTDLERSSVGGPLVLKLPMEAVIPVHIPGSPERHVGYYVLLDKNGNPLNVSSKKNHYKELSEEKDNTSDLSTLLAKTKEAMYGDKRQTSAGSDLEKSYIDLIEKNLTLRLQNGVYGDNVELVEAEEVYRIMMARALRKMETKIVFIPSEYMVYMAFNYDENGVGKSLLETSKIISSIRTTLMLSNTMATIRNSTPNVGLDIQLDEDDLSPAETVETILTEYSKNQVSGYKLGTIDPKEITDFLQKAGVSVNVSGNPRYPNTKVDLNDRARSITTVDTDLEETMRDRHIMLMGLSPEHIDASSGADFATNIVSNNLLLAKRVMGYQVPFESMLAEFIRKYTLSHAELMKELKEFYANNTKSSKKKKDDDDEGDASIEELVCSVTVSLPNPDTSKLENQIEAFGQYTDALDQALESYFNIEMFEGMIDTELEDAIEPMVAAIRGYYRRQWLRKNNVLPEVALLTETDEDGKPVFDLLDLHTKHAEAFLKSTEGALRKMRKKGRKTENKLEEDIDKEEEEPEEEEVVEEEQTEEESPEGDEPPESPDADEAFGDDTDTGSEEPVEEDDGETEGEAEGSEEPEDEDTPPESPDADDSFDF